MIKFDGVDLEDIAPVRIDDISVPPMDIQPVARQNVGIGQRFVRMTGGQRVITITFALLIENKDERHEALENIKEWAKPWKECALILPQDETKHFDCICTGYPVPSYRQWWQNGLQLVFTTFENPYWTSNDESRGNTGQQLTIGGTAPPLMRIERRLTSRVASQTYAANGRSMLFTQIPAGNMIIDLNKQTAEVSGTTIMQYFGKTSRFIEPVVGNMTITGNGTVYYRERWV